jgi:hypothetical protein
MIKFVVKISVNVTATPLVATAASMREKPAMREKTIQTPRQTNAEAIVLSHPVAMASSIQPMAKNVMITQQRKSQTAPAVIVNSPAITDF